MATTETKRGIQLPCPCCGETEANVLLCLADPDAFTCQECDTSFSREDVENLIAKWTRVLAWIDTMPGE